MAKQLVKHVIILIIIFLNIAKEKQNEQKKKIVKK